MVRRIIAAIALAAALAVPVVIGMAPAADAWKPCIPVWIDGWRCWP